MNVEVQEQSSTLDCETRKVGVSTHASWISTAQSWIVKQRMLKCRHMQIERSGTQAEFWQ